MTITKIILSLCLLNAPAINNLSNEDIPKEVAFLISISASLVVIISNLSKVSKESVDIINYIIKHFKKNKNNGSDKKIKQD